MELTSSLLRSTKKMNNPNSPMIQPIFNAIQRELDPSVPVVYEAVSAAYARMRWVEGLRAVDVVERMG